MISTSSTPQNTQRSKLLNTIPILNIISHNVLSLNSPVKQQLLFNLYESLNSNIVALQDIKLQTSLAVSAFKNKISNSYRVFSNIHPDPNDHLTGVALLLNQDLADRVYNHAGIWGRLIYVDIQLQNKFCIRIINTYITPSDNILRKKLYKKITTLFKQAYEK